MPAETIAWAHQTQCADPLTKLVLLMLADQADAEGVALIEPHQFTSLCCCSLDELKTALRWHLERGLIERVKDDPRIKRQTQVAYRLQGWDA